MALLRLAQRVPVFLSATGRRCGLDMMDLIFVTLTVVFAGAAVLYVFGCERL